MLFKEIQNIPDAEFFQRDRKWNKTSQKRVSNNTHSTLIWLLLQLVEESFFTTFQNFMLCIVAEFLEH